MCTEELAKSIKIKVKKFALNSLLSIAGYDISTGANDVIIVKQKDGSIKASPIQVYIKVTSQMRNAASSTKQGVMSKIQIGENNLLEYKYIQSSDLEHDETVLSFDISENVQHLQTLDIQDINFGNEINQSYFIVDELNIRIPLSVYVFGQDDKIIVSDIDGTITKSDTRGFFGGALGCKVHHENVDEFLRGLNENGYKIIYLTARNLRYMSYTKNYLFEKIAVNNVNGVGLPKYPVLCIPQEFAVAALADESQAVLGKSSSLNNVLSLFENPSDMFVGAYGNKNSDAEAYKNVGISLNKTFIINKQSEITNVLSDEKTTFQLQIEDLNNLFPKC